MSFSKCYHHFYGFSRYWIMCVEFFLFRELVQNIACYVFNFCECFMHVLPNLLSLASELWMTGNPLFSGFYYLALWVWVWLNQGFQTALQQWNCLFFMQEGNVCSSRVLVMVFPVSEFQLHPSNLDWASHIQFTGQVLQYQCDNGLQTKRFSNSIYRGR